MVGMGGVEKLRLDRNEISSFISLQHCTYLGVNTSKEKVLRIQRGYALTD